MESPHIEPHSEEHNVRHRLKSAIAVGLVTLGLSGHALPEAEAQEGNHSRAAEQGSVMKIPGLKLFDIGVADYNDDGFIDVFSANHSYPSALLKNNGHGKFKNVTNQAGYGQDLNFKNFEQAGRTPKFTEPGAYFYMSPEDGNPHKSQLNINAIDEPVTGKITLNPDHEVFFATTDKGTAGVESHDGIGTISFNIQPGGHFKTRTTLQVPAKVSVEGNTPVYVGPSEMPAPTNDFNLILPDHHADVFVDLNNDGQEDLFRVVGGLGGGIQMPAFRGKIPDITRLSTIDGYETTQLGLQKDNCRGRQGAAVDANADGLTDLWQSCEGDGSFMQYKHPDGTYTREVIPDSGESYRWLQSGPSSLPKLLALGKRASLWLRGDKGWEKTDSVKLFGGPGQTTLGDYNNDGSPDVFVSSSQGNSLVKVKGTALSVIKPAKIGLPEKSSASAWLDADNNGHLDLDSLPGGLYKNNDANKFRPTGDFKVDTNYGHLTWADFNNDGLREPIIGKSPREFAHYGKALFYGTNVLNPKQKSDWLEVDSPNEWATSRIKLKVPGERTQTAWVGQSETSNFSQGHSRVYFALPKHSKRAKISVTTPNGQTYKESSRPNHVVEIP